MSNMLIKTPDTISKLIMCLRKADKKTYLLAGGTDLIIKLKTDRIYEGTLIDLTGIKELKKIKCDNGYIRIGAAVTFNEIATNPELNKYCKCLVQAARQVGSTQIRNVATIGGNIANAFTGADAIPALMALNAIVTVIKSDRTKYSKPIDEIIEGSRKNTLGYDEAIIEIAIPIYTEDYMSQFIKLGSRSKVTISKLNVAVMINIDKETKNINDIRVVLGALGTKAFRAVGVETALKNREISEELYNDFENELVKQVELAIPNRSSLDYKREAIKGLATDIFFELFYCLIWKVK